MFWSKDGGLTPSFGELSQIAAMPFSIPIHPIVRPRGGDFSYTGSEINSMILDIELIKKLAASNQQIKIMPGCGVRANNIKLFIDAGLTEIHSSASKTIPSPMKYRNTNVSMSNSANDEFVRYQTNGYEIESMKKQMVITAH